MLAWLRGPKDSPTDYLHSEGGCNSLDTVAGVPNAHKQCRVDFDFTLRKAFQEAIGGDADHWPLEWCTACGGASRSCSQCANPTSLSQKERAIAQVERSYGRKYTPKEFYDLM